MQLFAMSQREMMAVAETDGLAEIMIKASQATEELTPAEKIRYLALQHFFFDSWGAAYLFHQDGMLKNEIWNGWDELCISIGQSRPLWGWIENLQNYTGADFMIHVDNALGYSGSEQP